MYCCSGRQPPECQCIYKYLQGNEERATSNVRGWKWASKPLPAPREIPWGKSHTRCTSTGKGQDNWPACSAQKWILDLVLRFTQPLQRGAAKIMSSSAQGGHWKLIPGEEGQGGAEGSSRRRPKPRGQNTPCSNFLPRALHRFWQQETQKIYGKNRKKKNLSWALTILSCQSQLNMQCIIKATLHWWYRIYERCPVSY